MSYWSGVLFLQHRFSSLNDRLTRGGPLAREPGGSSVGFFFDSDSRKSYTIGGNANIGWDESGALTQRVGLDIGLRPAANWDVRVGPSLNRNHSTAQYVQAITDPAATHTFGRRYVFADLEQTSVSLETRLNVNFTPDLSFELYAQPLLAR